MPELMLTVVKTWLETPTIPAIRLSLGGENFPFKAGQYCLVALKVNSVVAEGLSTKRSFVTQTQPSVVLTVGAVPGGPWEDHAFSTACAPNVKYLEFATRVSDSGFKKAFAALKNGDKVKVIGALGNFTLDENAKSVCFLSGGIGITPIRSMVQFATQEKLQLPITLLFGNRNPSEIPFKAELNDLQQQNKQLKVVHVVSEADANWKGVVGRIDAELIKKHSSIGSGLYYICGPPGMVDGLTNTLKTLGVSDERIKIERFSGYK